MILLSKLPFRSAFLLLFHLADSMSTLLGHVKRSGSVEIYKIYQPFNLK